MPRPRVSKPPIIEFDPTSSSATIRLLVQMCWPEPEEANARLAAFGLGLLGSHGGWRDFLLALSELADRQEVSRQEMSDLMRAHGFVPEVAKRLWLFIDSFGERDVALPEPDEPLKLFLAFCRRPDVQRALRGSVLEDHIKFASEVLESGGGFAAAAEAPPVSQIKNDIGQFLNGAPMLAGLVLTLIARIDKHHAPLTPSLNRACDVIEKMTRLRAPTRRVKADWTDWRPLAPIWAAVIAAAGYEADDPHSLYSAIIAQDGPARIVAYAKWFAEYASHQRSPNASEVLIPAREVVRLNVDVPLLEPDRPPLSDADLGAARLYQAATIRKGDYRRM